MCITLIWNKFKYKKIYESFCSRVCYLRLEGRRQIRLTVLLPKLPRQNRTISYEEIRPQNNNKKKKTLRRNAESSEYFDIKREFRPKVLLLAFFFMITITKRKIYVIMTFIFSDESFRVQSHVFRCNILFDP